MPDPALDEMMDAIARNLRSARQERAIGLSALARVSGLNKATLSRLETGGGNPTLETLFVLARALDVPVSRLLDEASTEPEARVVRADEGTRMRVDLGEVRLIRRMSGFAALEYYEVTMAPGARRVSAAHASGVVEHLLLLSGRAKAGPLRSPVTLAPGDLVWFTADQQHLYEALEEPVRFLLHIAYPTAPQTRSWEDET